MTKIIEIKETITNSSLEENLYQIQILSISIAQLIKLKKELNRDDYNYLCIITEKTKEALKKAYQISKI